MLTDKQKQLIIQQEKEVDKQRELRTISYEQYIERLRQVYSQFK